MTAITENKLATATRNRTAFSEILDRIGYGAALRLRDLPNERALYLVTWPDGEYVTAYVVGRLTMLGHGCKLESVADDQCGFARALVSCALERTETEKELDEIVEQAQDIEHLDA